MMQTAPLDVLAFGAHPDDVELAAGGTMLLCAASGYRTGIIDLTCGELGSRGTPDGRAREAEAAAEILGLAIRENLGLPDGNITRDGRLGLISALRKWRPRVVLTHPMQCRHPDHAHTASLVVEACYYGGLRKIATCDAQEKNQEPWRPQHVLHFAEVLPFEPSLVVDVSTTWEDRTRALQCYASQVHNPDYVSADGEPETYISNPEFSRWIEARARTFGYAIGAKYGEPFIYRGALGTKDLMGLLTHEAEFK